jgi:hypothetical protein
MRMQRRGRSMCHPIFALFNPVEWENKDLMGISEKLVQGTKPSDFLGDPANARPNIG